jgi:hypothetical protein
MRKQALRTQAAEQDLRSIEVTQLNCDIGYNPGLSKLRLDYKLCLPHFRVFGRAEPLISFT